MVYTTHNCPYTLDDGSATPIMLCDLEAVQTINAITIFPYNATGNIVKAMTVEFYDTPALSGTPVYWQTYANIPQSSTTLNLTNPTNARFVKFTMNENYDGDRYGVCNVMFDVSSIATPSSGVVNVNTHGGFSVNYLFDKDARTQWVTRESNDSGYYQAGLIAPEFTFNISEPKTLTSVTVQAYDVSGNSIKNFKRDFFDKDGNQISVSDASKYNFTMMDSTNSVQNYFSFPTVEEVASLKMTVTDNFKGVSRGATEWGFQK